MAASGIPVAADPHAPPATILVVEDERRIAELITRRLLDEGFEVRSELDGDGGLAAALDEDIDLVILDLNLPGLSGEQVLKRLSAVRPGLPVLILSAKDGVDDQVNNLSAGADDYLTKPFSFAELVARVQARLRQRIPRSPASLEHGRVRLDLHTRIASSGDNSVDLTAREFAVLETLLRHPNQVLSHEQLLSLVWGYDFSPGSNLIEVYIRHLRRKLGADIIETVRGLGYRFVG